VDKISNKLKDLTSISVADVSSKGISAFFWFYVASIIGPEIYGEIAYFLSIAAFASTVALFGSANTLIVYTAKNIKIQSALYALTLVSGSITSIVVFFIFYNIGTSFLILGYVIFGLVTSELLGRKLYRTYSKLVITQKILMVILTIGLYYSIGNEGIITGMALSYTPYIADTIKGIRKSKIEFSLVKERFNFLINSYLQTLSGALSGSLDKLVIAPLFGFALLGNYSLGLQFLTLLLIIPQTVGKYTIPQYSSGNENRKLRKIIVLFSIVLAVTGFVIGPSAMSWIFPKFVEVDEVIRIVSLSIIPTTIVLIYESKFLGMEKAKNIFIMSVIWVGTQILGIIVLGTAYGINGITASLVLGASSSAIYVVIVDELDKRKNRELTK